MGWLVLISVTIAPIVIPMKVLNKGVRHPFRTIGMIFHQQCGAGRVCVRGVPNSPARITNAMGFMLATLGDLQTALDYYARSQQIRNEIHDPFQESHALHNLCTVNRKPGRLNEAEVHDNHALELAQTYSLPDPEGYAWLHLGYVWLEQGVHQLAADAFRKSRACWRNQGRARLVIEAEAGMAATALAVGNADEARRRAEALFSYWETHGLHGVDEPMQIALTCYRAFNTGGDERARQAFARAHGELLAKALLITDAAHHTRFLTQVPANRQVMAAHVATCG